MDTQLFNTSVSIATAVVTSSTLAHGHPPYVVQTIVDLAFSTYEELKTRIAAVEAEEKAIEQVEFAKVRAKQAEAARMVAELTKSNRVSSEEVPAASDLPVEQAPSEDVQAAASDLPAEQASVEDAQAAASDLPGAEEHRESV